MVRKGAAEKIIQRNPRPNDGMMIFIKITMLIMMITIMMMMMMLMVLMMMMMMKLANE